MAGLVDGGVDQVREGLAWRGKAGWVPGQGGVWTGGARALLQERGGGGVGAMAVPKKGEGWGLVGCSKEREGVREGLAWRSGGVQGLRLRVGARTQKRSKFRNVCRRRMPCGTGAGLVDGGLDQGP